MFYIAAFLCKLRLSLFAHLTQRHAWLATTDTTHNECEDGTETMTALLGEYAIKTPHIEQQVITCADMSHASVARTALDGAETETDSEQVACAVRYIVTNGFLAARYLFSSHNCFTHIVNWMSVWSLEQAAEIDQSLVERYRHIHMLFTHTGKGDWDCMRCRYKSRPKKTIANEEVTIRRRIAFDSRTPTHHLLFAPLFLSIFCFYSPFGENKHTPLLSSRILSSNCAPNSFAVRICIRTRSQTKLTIKIIETVCSQKFTRDIPLSNVSHHCTSASSQFHCMNEMVFGTLSIRDLHFNRIESFFRVFLASRRTAITVDHTD